MDIEKVREVFKKDKYASKLMGAVIDEIGKNYSKCSFSVNENHLNAMDTVMGGAVFTLADFAFAVATNAEKMHVVSISSTISFLKASKGKKLIAIAQCIKDGRNTCVYEIELTDDTGAKIAVVTTTGYKILQ